jgi:hypothetical protein
MDADKLNRIIEQALNSLPGSYAYFILDRDEDTVRIRVVSASFANQKITDRIQCLVDVFSAHAEELLSEVIVLFEAWTPAEIKNLNKDISFSTDPDLGEAMAAKPSDSRLPPRS